jgi:NAD(P) transhydrogenase subunit beta
LSKLLEANGTEVSYAIHPVAGRMPGHMNVLLAEADVPYEQLVEMDLINPEFPRTDVVIVLGANDVVNPDAKNDPSSPLFGMPVLEVNQARQVFVVKRSLGAGYAGIRNGLFELPQTAMLFGDAKAVLNGLLSELRDLGVGKPSASGQPRTPVAA